VKYASTKIVKLFLAVAFALLAVSAAFGQATITIQNNDAAGVGFNDNTAAAPIGGNNGTTVGQQRLIAFQTAASIWGATLTSGPTIVIRANWAAQSCTANAGTLGAAGNAGNIWRDFSGAIPGFWYGNALANAISGADRNGASAEINATFNVSLGTPGCLENLHWYYGLDNNHGSTGVDLVSVLLHEFGHGLGFQTFTSTTTGAQAGSQSGAPFPSIFDRYLFDNATGKTWAQMSSDSERVASATNTGHLVWNGSRVLADAPNVLTGTPRLRVNSPAAIAGNYQVGTADFGPALSAAGITGIVGQSNPVDGCSAFGSSLTGKIALIDRGSCTFVTKTKNAQNAGAIGVIIADNVSSSTPPGMSGSDSTITIPTVSITLASGNTIKAQLSNNVNATLFADPSSVAGVDSSARPMMYAPNPVEAGSSVSHWDLSLTPNQVMEPNISGDLLHVLTPPRDLTFSLLRDLGWTGPIAPTILTEDGTNNASAIDSVTHTRAPFSNVNSYNLSTIGDTRTRIIFLTTDLGVTPTDDLSVLQVKANGISLVVEGAGPNASLAGTSYIVVRLDGLPVGTYNLTVTLRGVNSTNAPTITIQ
jgi:hypothetical protein